MQFNPGDMVKQFAAYARNSVTFSMLACNSEGDEHIYTQTQHFFITKTKFAIRTSNVTTKLHETSVCGCYNNAVIHKELFSHFLLSTYLWLPGSGHASVTPANIFFPVRPGPTHPLPKLSRIFGICLLSKAPKKPLNKTEHFSPDNKIKNFPVTFIERLVFCPVNDKTFTLTF